MYINIPPVTYINIPYEQHDHWASFGRDTKAPSWCVGADPDLPNVVFLRCGGCLASLELRAHSIDIDGVVHPSILHKCNPLMQEDFRLPKVEWHVWGKLLDWKNRVGKIKAPHQDLV